jgi:Family of unknown function (DUF5681)
MSHTERTESGRFQPGRSGNPAGRPPGSRNKATLAIEALMEGGAEKMTKQLVELAGYGNLAAVRICLDRLAPRRKGRPIAFALPRLEQAGDAVVAASAVVEGVASAELTPGEAAELFRVIEAFERVRQRSDLERRVAKLEQALAGPAPADAPAAHDVAAVAPESRHARAETTLDAAGSAAQPAAANAAAKRTAPPAAAETPAPDNTGESTGRAAAADPAPTPGSPETTGESTGAAVVGAAAAPPRPPRRPEPPEWPEWPEYPQYLALQEKRRQAELAAQSPGGT